MTERRLLLSRRRWLQALVVWPVALATQAQDKPKMRVGFITRYQPYSFAQSDGALTGFYYYCDEVDFGEDGEPCAGEPMRPETIRRKP